MPASAFSTVPISPGDLHNVWSFVRQGLLAVHRKTKPDWIIEDIYASVRSGQATLALSKIDDHVIGFIVFYPMNAAFSGRKEMFIWVAYTIPLRERATSWDVTGAIEATYEQVEQLARAQGCLSVTTLSPRPAFLHFAGKFGFKPVHTAYRKVL